MRSFFQSFRGRLTLWSMIVLAIALASFSFALGYANLNRLSEQIDRELANRGRRTGQMGPPAGGGPGRPGGQGGFGGPGGFDGEGGQGGFGGGQGQNPPPRRGPGGPPDGEAPQPGQPPSFGDPEADRIASLRRPRFFDAQGRPAGMFVDDVPFDPKALINRRLSEESFSTVTFDGERLRVFTVPWRRGGEVVGSVQVARELREYDDLRQSQLLTLLTLTPLALIVTALGAFFLAGRALKPIGQMKSAAEAIGEGDLSQRLDVRGEDELASLGAAFNEMAHKLDLSFTEQKAAYEALQEAYESQRRFTADASHELRTPLARLQLATSSALAGPDSGHRQALETADRAAQQMARLVRQLLTLARADAGQLGLRHEIIDLRLVASNAANGCQKPVDVSLEPGPVFVQGDEDHLERVVSNLLENACRYTPDDGSIALSVAIEGSNAVLIVRDTGEGIPAEHLPHVFERFYRVDAARSRADGGCGLGLAICKSVIEAHGGTIEIESEAGSGATVRVTMPLISK